MGKFDQQMREVERSLANLTGNKAQAAKIRKGLERKIQQAAVKAQPKIAENLVKSGRAGWANAPCAALTARRHGPKSRAAPSMIPAPRKAATRP